MNKSIVSTGGHLIDTNCKFQTGNLYQSNSVVYSCTLNQTDLGKNANKFYIMQVIVNGPQYVVFIRYGRIGETGTINYKEFSSESPAKSFFEKQFRTKTGNAWLHKDNFEKKSGHYFLTEIECIEESSESSESEISVSTECKLDKRIVHFLELISNQTYMKNSLVQLEIDTDKMPLGKISQTQIDKGYIILDKINKNMNQKNMLIELSSEFYTLIPMATGRRQPPVINSSELLGKYVNLLNELSQMVYGSKTSTKKSTNDSALMKLYDELQTEFIPLDTTDVMYSILVDYLKHSKAPTHNFKYDVLDIFQIERPHEQKLYDKYSKKIKNKTLLFHGTRISNLIGILKNGLVVDPSKLGINVSITGKMFGMGLYFANSCSKSINYCGYDSSDNIACLFVSEVALGKMLKKTDSDSSLTADRMPSGYHSTWGMGASSFTEYDCYDDGSQIPSGNLSKRNDGTRYGLLYDEFIVYHEEQIRLRYIIKLKIH